jgi:tetrahydromethanopterin S-methyltransferase subunit A
MPDLVANPNIRFLIVCGPESPGHLVGDAILALKNNGIDRRRRIIGAKGPTPFLFNILPEFVQRFREQITVHDLVNEGSPEVVRAAVCACYQETPTPFREYLLHDPGPFPGGPLIGKITWRITDPSRQPTDEQALARVEKARALSDRIKRAVEDRKRRQDGPPS